MTLYYSQHSYIHVTMEGESRNEGTWKNRRGRTGGGREHGATDVRLHKATNATVGILS